jgi:hypothetical protein
MKIPPAEQRSLLPFVTPLLKPVPRLTNSWVPYLSISYCSCSTLIWSAPFPVLQRYAILTTPKTVRRLALSALNSAARTKAYLIRDHLQTLLPTLYRETVIKPDLIRTVQMGPWTHKVDDGLEARKTAYETLYTLVRIDSRYESKKLAENLHSWTHAYRSWTSMSFSEG